VVQRIVPESEARAALHADAAIHPPDLVVLPAIDAITALAGRQWHARGIHQLPVVVSGGLLHIGPLVRPHSGPCLGCLDLHRGARDPDWASWQAVRAGVPDHERDLDAAPELRSAAAALTAWIASGDHVDRALPVGVSLSMQRPHPRLHHHLWTRHPSCNGCAVAGATMDA
jgi:bacteriocin biosynthesis cyclodehydratase domain-containing protein